MLDTAGIVTPASSIAAARVMLTQWETDGAAPTPTYPAYLDIENIIYRADGTKSADGTWIISPVNEVEFANQSSTDGAVYTLSAGQDHGLVTSSIGARPYDRAVYASAALIGTVLTGEIDAWVRVGEQKRSTRFPSGDAASTSPINLGIVRAGVAAPVGMGVSGAGTDGGKIDLSANASYNTLNVMAWPITMA
jgi:hypothetical protein